MDNNEEEFHFTEEENTQKYESTARPSAVVSTVEDDKARRKKLIIIIVGAVIGLVCLYKLYDLFTTPAPTKSIAATMPQPQQASPKPMPAPVIAAEQPVVKSDKISALEQAVSQNGAAQESLQNQIGELSSAIGGIQNNIAMLSQQINQLSQSKTKPQPQETAKTQAEPKKVTKKTAIKPKASGQTFYVRAAIQGRAWLMSPKGDTFTISMGDELPGYGTVQAIDPDKGTVMTSSGRTIGFMPQDK